MNCDKCNSHRIVSINAKCSDLFSMEYNGKSFEGYVPQNLFFGEGGYGDYVRLVFCLECGKIQGKFPITNGEVEMAMGEEGEIQDEFQDNSDF